MTETDITIRPAADGDVERLSELLCDCYRYLGRVEPLTNEQVRRMIDARAGTAHIRGRLAEQTWLVACDERGGCAVRAVPVRTASLSVSSSAKAQQQEKQQQQQDEPVRAPALRVRTDTARTTEPAWDGGRIVGLLCIGGNEVDRLFVDPAVHRGGVGRRLFAAAEQLLRGRGHAEMTLGAWPSAVPFYQRMGMTIAGRKASGFLDGKEFVTMTKRLMDDDPSRREAPYNGVEKGHTR